MGTKPMFALIGLVCTGITLSGCESCDACRANKPWGQNNVTASAAPTSLPNSVATNTMGGNQALPVTGNSPNAAAPAMPTSQSVRITDPGINPGALAAPGSSGGAAASANSLTGAQPAMQYPGVPAYATSPSSFNSGSRTVNGANAAPAQSGWPTVTPAGAATGMNPSYPLPANPSPTGDSSYQTRYPQLQPTPSVPTMPKPGSSPNE
jgi:hypothetical protein